uniref:Uncharacterized protein n=1 Tax=Oryza punctata TaxID=4537 RepID=A0A0E0K6G9_ORYPU
MAIACAVTVSVPSLTGKNNFNFNFHQWQWRERGSHLRGGGVAARFSGKSTDAKADTESGRIEVTAIKYGSILLPDITRPNIVVALLMVSIPVVVAVLLLFKYQQRVT